jgi:hypothetical protein
VNYTCRFPAMARVLYDALVEDDFYRTLESAASDDAETAQQAMIRYLDYSMIEAEEYGQPVQPSGANHSIPPSSNRCRRRRRLSSRNTWANAVAKFMKQ